MGCPGFRGEAEPGRTGLEIATPPARRLTFAAVTTLPRFQGLPIHVRPEQDKRALTQVATPVELGLAVELVGSEVEIPIMPQRHGIGPDHPRILGDDLVTAVAPPPADGVVLVV